MNYLELILIFFLGLIKEKYYSLKIEWFTLKSVCNKEVRLNEKGIQDRIKVK